MVYLIDIDPSLDKDGEAVGYVDDEPVYIKLETFYALADAFGLAVVRMPLALKEE